MSRGLLGVFGDLGRLGSGLAFGLWVDPRSTRSLISSLSFMVWVFLAVPLAMLAWLLA